MFNNFKLLTAFLFLACLAFSSCSKVSSRDTPTNALERAKKNVSEGRGAGIGGLIGGNKSNTFEFSTSNPLWRASLEILDFLPLSNVDYSGGIIISDWYSDSLSSNDALKINLQFLSNEIRSDSIKISIFKKRYNTNNICTVSKTKSKIEEELKRSILTKAAQLKKRKTKK